MGSQTARPKGSSAPGSAAPAWGCRWAMQTGSHSRKRPLGDRWWLGVGLQVLLSLLAAPGHDALKVSTRVEGTDQLAAVVLEPMGLAAGAQIAWRCSYDAARDLDFLNDTSSVLVLADKDQMAQYYRRTPQNDATYFESACLAPAALRIELGPSQPLVGAFRVPYTGLFTTLVLQCAPGFAGVLDLTIDVTTLNPNAAGRLVHHLGLESLLLPRVFGALFAATVVLLAVYLVDLALLTRPHVTALHLGLALGLGVKAVELAMLMGYFAALDRSGSATGMQVSSKLRKRRMKSHAFVLAFGPYLSTH